MIIYVILNSQENERLASNLINNDKLVVVVSTHSIIPNILCASVKQDGFSTFILNSMCSNFISLNEWTKCSEDQKALKEGYLNAKYFKLF